MLWGRRLSLAIGILAFSAGLILLLSRHVGVWFLTDLAIDLAGACVLGLLTGWVHAAMHARHEAGVFSIIRQLDQSAQLPGPVKPLPRPGWGLDELSRTTDVRLTQLRQRIETLVAQKRELEIQMRIMEAECQHAHTVLNSIADGVLVTNPFNEVALANASAARVLGFELDLVKHQPVEQVVRDPALEKMIKDTREGGDMSLRRHVEHRLQDRHPHAIYDITLTCVGGPETAGTLEPGGVVTILRDVTREREIAEMKSDFVSSVSHELRTPLSSIKAYLEMLIDGEVKDEHTRGEFYQILQAEANRLSRLIDNILNLSRIESGVVKAQREQIDLTALVKEAIEVISPQARAKQVQIQEVPTPLFFQVFADRDMIFQVLLNLLGNAIKYTPNGGKVTATILVDEYSHLVSVAISDTGVGIPLASQPHLFQKFYRVAEHKKMAKGTGLGLNLVKQIVENVHGGTVGVVSQPGKGSTFTFSLPMADNSY